MTATPESLHAIATPPPNLGTEEVIRVVRDDYGLRGELQPLLGERDQNFRLTVRDGERYVVKIANTAEDPRVTDLQVCALQHMARHACAVTVPRVIPNRRDDLLTAIPVADSEYLLRIVTYLPGRPLEEVRLDAGIAAQLGRCLAGVGAALRDFDHPGDTQALIWDIRRVDELRRLVTIIGDQQLRDEVVACLDDMSQRVLPEISRLRTQVIHNDLNPGNVVVTDDERPRVAGVIDFGDMLRAPLIVDVGVAAAYMRGDSADAMALIAEFVAGYDAVTPLDDAELECLYELVRARLATSLAILHWRLSALPDDDAYTREAWQGGDSAVRLLRGLGAIPRAQFTARLKSRCRAGRD